jgi:hypothetical protein
MRTSLIILLALVCAPAAVAAGPWLGTADQALGYTTDVRNATTEVAGPAGSVSLAGKWGLPRVTMNGAVGGLSSNRRVLVLAQQISPNGMELQRTSSFAVLQARPLRLVRTVTLRGDFGYDALSPDGRTLYLIEHVSIRNLFQYRVRAYDLRSHRLLPRAIADKRQRDWIMNGMPVARATSPGGRWVYTLYSSGNNYPFVHALDTVGRTAVCVGLPWDWAADQQAIDGATMKVAGGKLAIGGLFSLDRATFKVTKSA